MNRNFFKMIMFIARHPLKTIKLWYEILLARLLNKSEKVQNLYLKIYYHGKHFIVEKAEKTNTPQQ